MNVYAPTSGGPWPLIVVSPGGIAEVGDQFYLDIYAALLASQGAVVMESPWRQIYFAGSGYPTAFADVACAIGIARKIGPYYGGESGPGHPGRPFARGMGGRGRVSDPRALRGSGGLMRPDSRLTSS